MLDMLWNTQVAAAATTWKLASAQLTCICAYRGGVALVGSVTCCDSELGPDWQRHGSLVLRWGLHLLTIREIVVPSFISAHILPHGRDPRAVPCAVAKAGRCQKWVWPLVVEINPGLSVQVELAE